MSRRTNTNRRIETRAQREARQFGSTPRRARARTPSRRAGRGGFLSNLPLVPIAIVLGAVVIVGLLFYLVLETTESPGTPESQTAQLDDSADLPGAYFPPHPGADGAPDTGDERLHLLSNVTVPFCTPEQIAANTISNPLCYTSNPPTSGPHAGSPLPFRVLDNPAPKENLLHNMEHAGVVVWYNTTDQATIDRLKSVVAGELDRGRLVVMSAYTEMELETIALTSWTRLDKFPASSLDDGRVRDFIRAHQRRFNPEGF